MGGYRNMANNRDQDQHLDRWLLQRRLWVLELLTVKAITNKGGSQTRDSRDNHSLVLPTSNLRTVLPTSNLKLIMATNRKDLILPKLRVSSMGNRSNPLEKISLKYPMNGRCDS